jgi:hypothetical protein
MESILMQVKILCRFGSIHANLLDGEALLLLLLLLLLLTLGTALCLSNFTSSPGVANKHRQTYMHALVS